MLIVWQTPASAPDMCALMPSNGHSPIGAKCAHLEDPLPIIAEASVRHWKAYHITVDAS